jgi:hypothetical protein
MTWPWQFLAMTLSEVLKFSVYMYVCVYVEYLAFGIFKIIIHMNVNVILKPINMDNK